MQELLTRYPALSACRADIEKALALIIQTYRQGGKLLLCGNGGSAADCEHIVGELMKGFLKKRPITDASLPHDLRCGLQGALPAISLPSQCALLSAYGNDVAPHMAYAQLVYGYAAKQDLLVGLSTSGNSENVVRAFMLARARGIATLALTGEGGGRLAGLADITIKVPQRETYLVQELHLPVYHYLCAKVEEHFFAE